MFFIHSVLFLGLLQISISVDPCTTFKGEDGDCVPINQCPSIYAFFTAPSSYKEKSDILKSRCGFVQIYPKVCCPTDLRRPLRKNNLLPSPPSCGNDAGQFRLYGGDETALDEFPWTALLIYRRNQMRCGGVLINTRYILTARHCLTSDLVRVRLGEWDISTNPDSVRIAFDMNRADPFVEVLIEEQIQYDGPRDVIQNDIALLRLNRNVKFTNFIQPICLPTSSDLKTKSFLGNNVTVSGWGLTETKALSDVKLKVEIPVVGLRPCERGLTALLRGYIRPSLISGNPICAGGHAGKNSCAGDSGGPLMYKNEYWYAVGVVSYGLSCRQKDTHGFYVRVGSHMNWIIKNMKP